MIAAAKIPLGPINFTGCICAIKFEGREYRLASYKGAKVLEYSGRGAVICQGKYRLELKVLSQNPQPLKAPSSGIMIRTVKEDLSAKVLCIFEYNGELLFEHTDEMAGFEFSET